MTRVSPLTPVLADVLPGSAAAETARNTWPWFLNPQSPMIVLAAAVALAAGLLAIFVLYGLVRYLIFVLPNRGRLGWNCDPGAGDGGGWFGSRGYHGSGGMGWGLLLGDCFGGWLGGSLYGRF